MNEIQKAAEENLENFVDDFTERAGVLFNILQRQLHKSSFSVNGKFVTVTIQRKVYTGGTSKPSPTRRDVIDPEGYQGGLADGEF